MKALKPSAKENKRYLKIRGSVGDVERAILDFVGVNGMSKCGLSWVEKKKDSGIICVNREAVDSVQASVCVWLKKIEVVKVSGTIKGLGK